MLPARTTTRPGYSQPRDSPERCARLIGDIATEGKSVYLPRNPISVLNPSLPYFTSVSYSIPAYVFASAGYKLPTPIVVAVILNSFSRAHCFAYAKSRPASAFIETVY